MGFTQLDKIENLHSEVLSESVAGPLVRRCLAGPLGTVGDFGMP